MEDGRLLESGGEGLDGQRSCLRKARSARKHAQSEDRQQEKEAMFHPEPPVTNLCYKLCQFS
jgi:hypothetical protein